MNVRGVLLAAVLSLACCFSAGAFTLDGDWSDWFSYSTAVYSGGSAVTAANGANSWVAPDVINAGVKYFDGALRSPYDAFENDTVTPGALNSQLYDIEAVMTALVLNDPDDASAGGQLWFGMVTGYNSKGDGTHPSTNSPHFAGDVFLDLNWGGSVVTNSWDYAVGTSVYRPGYPNGPQPGNENETRLGTLYTGIGLVTDSVSDFHNGNPYRVKTATETQTNIAAWGGGNGDGEFGGDRHNFLELYVALTGTEVQSIIDNGSFLWHWTMSCGNDWVDFGNTTPFNPVPVVPEPATVALLCLGLVGIVARKRFVA